jgi:hypothetical protein
MNRSVENSDPGVIIEAEIQTPGYGFGHPGMKEKAMRAIKSFLPAALLGAGILVCVSASYATSEIAKKEKKSCTFCHAKVTPADKEGMKKNLNEAGKYYAEKKSLEGYVEKKK